MSAQSFEEVEFLFFDPKGELALGVSATLVLPLLKIRAEQDPLPLTDRVDRRIIALRFMQHPTDDGDDKKTFRICLRCGAPIVHGACVKCVENMNPGEYASLVAVPEKVERFVRDFHPDAFPIGPEAIRVMQRNMLATTRKHSSPRSANHA